MVSKGEGKALDLYSYKKAISKYADLSKYFVKTTVAVYYKNL